MFGTASLASLYLARHQTGLSHTGLPSQPSPSGALPFPSLLLQSSGDSPGKMTHMKGKCPRLAAATPDQGVPPRKAHLQFYKPKLSRPAGSEGHAVTNDLLEVRFPTGAKDRCPCPSLLRSTGGCFLLFSSCTDLQNTPSS